MSQINCPHCESLFEDLGDAFCPICREDLNEPVEPLNPEAFPGSETTSSDEQREPPSMFEINRACQRLATKLAKQDCTSGMIINRLKELGADDALAKEITEQAIVSVKNLHRSNGFWMIVFGAVIASVGLFISIGSIAFASEGGGTVLVTYGIVAVGLGILFRGLIKMVSGTDSVE